MVSIALTKTKLAGTATGDLALYDKVTVQFSGRVFADHTYYIVGAEANKSLLTAWIAATRSPSELFVSATVPFDTVALETYLATQYKRHLYVWLYDDTDDEFLGYGTVSIMAAPTPAGFIRYEQVDALPISPTAGTLYYLTEDDDVAKASEGLYAHDGIGWTCIAYFAAYDLGNLTEAVGTLTLIPGLKYTAVKTGTITSMAIVPTRPGIVNIHTTGAQTVAIPTVTGFTVLGYGGTAAAAWADAGAAFSDWSVEVVSATHAVIRATALEA